MTRSPLPRLLIAASGTGGHVFPAIALAEQLADYQIEWLGVPNRMEQQLVGDRYRLHTVNVEGFQGPPGIGTLKTAMRLVQGVFKVRGLLKRGQFQGVVTTGGYIAGPSIIAARLLGLPVILHESNALPGKVTRFFGPYCSLLALGFEEAARYVPKAKALQVGTPVRQAFMDARNQLDLPIPSGVPLVVVVGGSQGAVALNRLVRDAAPKWLAMGIWVVHLTGDRDPDQGALQHPHYLVRPFYDNMAALFERADLAISRSGAGTLTELAITETPSILIPFPFAAEDHQTFNARIFADAGAALLFQQSELSAELLESKVLALMAGHVQRDTAIDPLRGMAVRAGGLAVRDSADRLAQEVRRLVK